MANPPISYGLPNSLGISKLEYYQAVWNYMVRTVEPPVTAIVHLTDLIYKFYHCEIPIAEAKMYLCIFAFKLKEQEEKIQRRRIL